MKLNESNQYDAIVKNVFADTKLYVKINCMDPDGKEWSSKEEFILK